MSIPANGNVPGAFATICESFTTTNGTKLRPVTQTYAAAGNFTGGCRVFDLFASNTDASNAKTLQVYDGTVLTTQGTSPTGAMAVVTQNTITRANGSYITDGWRVGQTAVLSAPVGSAENASDGIPVIITAVNALSLVLNGTLLTNETLVAGTRLIRAAQRTVVSVPASAGANSSTANVALIGTSTDTSKDTSGIELGTNDLLLIGPGAALAALPAQLHVTGKIALR